MLIPEDEGFRESKLQCADFLHRFLSRKSGVEWKIGRHGGAVPAGHHPGFGVRLPEEIFSNEYEMDSQAGGGEGAEFGVVRRCAPRQFFRVTGWGASCKQRKLCFP